MQSCVKRPAQRATLLPCEEGLPRILSKMQGESYTHMRGRVRIDLPRYRVRGICTIRSTPAGDLRIDFHHSSLFGSYREDATIFLRRGRLGILDRERSAFFGNDSTLAMLRDHLGFNIFPDDIAYILLLSRPECAEVESASVSNPPGGDWRLSGTWRERRIEIQGGEDGAPSYFRQCWDEEPRCYIANYEYNGTTASRRYPSRIAVSREYGSERLVLTIRDIKREHVAEEVFALFDTLEQ